MSMFKKDVFRHIDGVIMAQNTAYKWQELDEFVLTKESTKHLEAFTQSYNAYFDKAPSAHSNTGVWISGFFGSGKSHFLKILSYLIANESITNDVETKTPLEFFRAKISDNLFMMDLEKMTRYSADVMLLNIEDRANIRTDSNSNILEVLLKEFNRIVGLCEAYPQVAQFERGLQQNGLYNKFCEIYQTQHQQDWSQARNQYLFKLKQVAECYSQLTNDQYLADTMRSIIGDGFILSVDEFCKLVKDYLSQKGSNHRIVYCLDEIGQFVGDKVDRLLQLQTIIESLSVQTNGQVMIVVTAQQAIDELIDFNLNTQRDALSKITGRFATRLSLTSANVDEVIQKRLLDKTDTAQTELCQYYQKEADILRHKLLFKDNRRQYPEVTNASTYADFYPFLPYQIELLQDTFDGIRKHGIVGMNLAHGERSLLGSFQTALKEVIKSYPEHLPSGTIVPLHQFYASIHTWLSGRVAATIENARRNLAIVNPEFSILVLQTLFMVRYVDTFVANVNNLTVLMLDNINVDMITLKEQIQASLESLETQSLISRNGEVYKFLTDEEQDVSRQIASMLPEDAEVLRALKEIIVDNSLTEIPLRKYTHTNNKVFEYDWQIDGQDIQRSSNSDFKVNFITEYNKEQHDLYTSNSLISVGDDNQIVFVLAQININKELMIYVKTNKFFNERPQSQDNDVRLERILSEKRQDNNTRKIKLITLMKDSISGADCFIDGRKIDLNRGAIKVMVNGAIEYYVSNKYSQLNLIAAPYSDPVNAGVKALVLNGFVDDMFGHKSRNLAAYHEVERYINLLNNASRRISLNLIIREQFARKPYGWPENQIAAIVAELFVNNAINLVKNNQALPKEAVAEVLFEPRGYSEVFIEVREITAQNVIEDVSKLYNELFNKFIAEHDENTIAKRFTEELEVWSREINQWLHDASRISLPLDQTLLISCEILNQIITSTDKTLLKINNVADQLRELNLAVKNTRAGFSGQLLQWQELTLNLPIFTNEAEFFIHDEDSEQSLAKLAAIKTNQDLTQLPVIRRLVHSLKEKYKQHLTARKEELTKDLESSVNQVGRELDLVVAESDFRNKILLPLNREWRTNLEVAESFTKVIGLQQNLDKIRNNALIEIHSYAEEQAKQNNQPKVAIKRIVKISPRSLANNHILENSQDVENYIQRLKSELMNQIDADNRVEIQ